MKNQKLLKYLTAGSALAIAGVSNADIVYVDVDPDHTVPQFHNTGVEEFFNIIIGNDTVMKIGNFHSYWTSNSVSSGNPGSTGTWNGLWAEGQYYSSLNSSSRNAVVQLGSFNGDPLADTLQFLDIIGASNNWNTWGWLGYFSVWGSGSGNGIVGNFNDVNEKYIGARFNINGSIHYAWLRFDVSSYFSTFSFKDYAYQDCPDVPIFAGQKSDTIVVFGCDTATFNGKMYMTSGIVYDSLAGFSSGNCSIDNLLPIRVTLGSFIDTNDVNINEGDSIMLGGSYQLQSGLYVDSLKSNKGCDSIIYTNLEVIPFLGSPTPEKLNTVKVYPNPSTNSFNIDLSKFDSKANITLIDNSGKVVRQEQYSANNLINLNVENAGIYFLRIEGNDKSELIKLIKE